MLRIQRDQAEAAASSSEAGAVVPCTGRVDVPALGGPGTMSEGREIFLPDVYAGIVVYATRPPLASVKLEPRHWPTVTHEGKVYEPYLSRSYAPTGKFVKDCLHTAEEINARAALTPGEVRSKVAGTDEAFGDDDDANVGAALRHAVDGAAAPALGQAYVIVDTKWKDGPGGAPYHAAAVVAADGADRLTLEVFASASDGRRTVKDATYRMYSTGGGSMDTFHAHWERAYFTSNARTIVVEPR